MLPQESEEKQRRDYEPKKKKKKEKIVYAESQKVQKGSKVKINCNLELEKIRC